MSGERIVHIPDVRVTDQYRTLTPSQKRFLDAAGGRTVLNVPLRKDGALLGAITAVRPEIRPFTEKQIALLENFAAQAVIAMENVRLITETREALEQQTATAEVLQVINASPGDLAPVFDAILDKALDLCGATFGHLLTWDGEYLNRVAARGASPDEALLQRYKPIPGSAGDRFLRGENVICSADLREEEAYRAGSPGARVLVDRGGARSYLAVGLRKDEEPLGAIAIYRTEVRPFSDKQIALLQNFAAQAVIAMENARLITETREALEQQTATAEILGVINSSPGDLEPVFNAILEKAHALCGADHGSLTLRDGDKFRAVATYAYTEAWAERLREGLPIADNPVFEALLNGADFVHIPDVVEIFPSAAFIALPLARESFEATGARTALFMPLRKDGVLLGHISEGRREVRPFTDKQIALLQNFAAQAVIAMENARLITETREALEQQTATAEVLEVINSSPGDLKPVFDAILEKATRVCEAAFGAMLTWDGERVHWVAFRGLPTELVEALQQPMIPGDRRPIADRIVRGETVISTPDLREADYRDAPIAQAFLRHGTRSCVHVAMRKEERLLGYFTIYREQVRPFTDKEIALFQNFAAQAVIAMENARLITETREALDQQTATAEVLGVINSSPGNLEPVFDAMLEKATRLCEAPFGNLRTWDGDRFQFGAVYGDPQFSDWVRMRGPVQPNRDGNSPLERIIKGEQVVRFTVKPGDEGLWNSAGFMEMVKVSGMRSGILVALRKDDALLGTISVYRQDVRPFLDEQVSLLQNFAAQAVIAMENARLLGELRQRTEEVAELNRGLEARVAEQVDELGRVGRLKRFLAPQLAELIVSHGDEKILESHRREIVVVFCDLRGYTAFTETAEPEEVLDFLREYHGALGPLVSQFEGTLDQFSGDGIMVFFNDPVPIPDPAERAVNMSIAMREAASALISGWRRLGRDLGFGAGIAQGYATLGQIGFSERSGYTAIGTVCNVAARLCAEAKDGQILLSQRVAARLNDTVTLEEIGALTLKGLTQPVIAFNVPLAANHPALRVIEGGPPSA
jgi:GAF domain-containing protein